MNGPIVPSLAMLSEMLEFTLDAAFAAGVSGDHDAADAWEDVYAGIGKLYRLLESRAGAAFACDVEQFLQRPGDVT